MTSIQSRVDWAQIHRHKGLTGLRMDITNHLSQGKYLEAYMHLPSPRYWEVG
jgi:hypothetical protein